MTTGPPTMAAMALARAKTSPTGTASSALGSAAALAMMRRTRV